MRSALTAVCVIVGFLAVALLYVVSILRSLLRLIYGEPEPEGSASLMLTKIKPYAKAAVAVAGIVATVAKAVLAPDATEVSVLIALATAVGVYAVKNKPSA